MLGYFGVSRKAQDANERVSCGGCEFSLEQTDGQLRCQRYPPVIIQTGSQWPNVHPDAWCGEGKKKREQVKTLSLR